VANGKLAHLGDLASIKKFEGNLHNKVMEDAGKFDKRFQGKINDSSYVKALDDQRDKIARSLMHHPNSPQLQGEWQQLEDWINAPHSNLQEMIEHNKELNQVYGGKLATGEKMREWLPSFAIKNIKNTIRENLNNNTLNTQAGKKMLDAIESANKATKERVKYEMFQEAKYPEDIFKIFNKMDSGTQKKLFSDSDILKMHIYENAINKAKKVLTPPHLRGIRDFVAPFAGRLPGATAVGIGNQPMQPISFLDEQK
jgi:hypothetical protein